MNKAEHNGLAGGWPTSDNHERLLYLLEATLQREAAAAESDELEQLLLAGDAARTTAVRFFNLQSLLDRFESEVPADMAAEVSPHVPPREVPAPHCQLHIAMVHSCRIIQPHQKRKSRSFRPPNRARRFWGSCPSCRTRFPAAMRRSEP